MKLSDQRIEDLQDLTRLALSRSLRMADQGRHFDATLVTALVAHLQDLVNEIHGENEGDGEGEAAPAPAAEAPKKSKGGRPRKTPPAGAPAFRPSEVLRESLEAQPGLPDLPPAPAGLEEELQHDVPFGAVPREVAP